MSKKNIEREREGGERECVLCLRESNLVREKERERDRATERVRDVWKKIEGKKQTKHRNTHSLQTHCIANVNLFISDD